MARLLVVEDHALVREGLVQTLRQLEVGTRVFEAADCEAASILLGQEQSIDLMVLDLGLPGMDGLSYLAMLRQQYPQMPVVILSAYDDAHTVSKALKAGASGFVPKTYSSDRLLAALREVISGQVFSPERSALSSADSLPRTPISGSAEPSEFGLTGRQAEVLSLMVRGKSNKDIAGFLGLSEGTVKIHLTAIFKALKVSSRTQAMVVVARHGIKL